MNKKFKNEKEEKKLILSPSLDRTLHGNTRLNLRLSIYIKTLLSFYFKLSYHFFVPFAKKKKRSIRVRIHVRITRTFV